MRPNQTRRHDDPLHHTAAGVSKRKLDTAAAEFHAALETEIDAELQAEADRERAHIRSLGLRLAVVDDPEDEEARQGSRGVSRGEGGIERVMQATARRLKQRQLVSKEWIKFAEDVQGRAPP